MVTTRRRYGNKDRRARIAIKALFVVFAGLIMSKTITIGLFDRLYLFLSSRISQLTVVDLDTKEVITLMLFLYAILSLWGVLNRFLHSVIFAAIIMIAGIVFLTWGIEKLLAQYSEIFTGMAAENRSLVIVLILFGVSVFFDVRNFIKTRTIYNE